MRCWPLATLLLLAAACGGSATGRGAAAPPTPTPPPTASNGPPTCPRRVLRDGPTHGTACMDPNVLGEMRVESCGAYLMSQGWTRDLESELALYQSYSHTFACYRAPR